MNDDKRARLQREKAGEPYPYPEAEPEGERRRWFGDPAKTMVAAMSVGAALIFLAYTYVFFVLSGNPPAESQRAEATKISSTYDVRVIDEHASRFLSSGMNVVPADTPTVNGTQQSIFCSYLTNGDVDRGEPLRCDGDRIINPKKATR
ncbi:hypothetical protein V6N00_12490 [Tersicoccus sp. MR15.9]|uniref:hypothetical protein n=1 Tax=Tersicoccus mangrovi TaxID=3121635 RepID=UPI002FE678FC